MSVIRKGQSRSSASIGFHRATMVACAALLCAGLLSPGLAHARPMDCKALKGARIIAADGTFLGRFSDPASRDSLFNRSGPFGSKSASNSLWNARGPYGSTGSAQSPMNAFAGKPASIVKDGQTLGKLMRNSLRSWFEDPAKLVHRCYAFVP